MPYINQSDLETRYGIEEIRQLADRDGDTLHDESVVDTAINDAESLVNSFLARKVATPVAVPSDDLKRIVSDIARFYLYDDSVPEIVENNYKSAVTAINQFANGDRLIHGVNESHFGDLAMVKTGHTRVFSDDSLKGF